MDNTQALKEIRGKSKHNHLTMTGIKLYDEIICEQIQQASYELGRDEVIAKVEEAINPLRLTQGGEHYPHNVLIKLLTSLKEKK